MAWIESHQELARHPKTKKLARLLGVSLPAAVGHLHFLWWWAMDYAQDGDLSRYDEADIADACGWDGDPAVMVRALVDSGFLDSTDDGLTIHDWHEYAGRLIEKREQNKERKKKSRARHAPVTRPSRGQDEDGNDGHASVTGLPNHTKPNNDDDDIYTRTRDDKFAEAYRTFEQHFGLLNPTQTETLGSYIDAGMEPEMIEDAAVETRRRGFGADYFWGILKNCSDRGILTRQAFREDQERFEQKKANRTRAGPANRLQVANESLIRSIMEAEERDRNRSAEVVPYHPEHI